MGTPRKHPEGRHAEDGDQSRAARTQAGTTGFSVGETVSDEIGGHA